MNILRDNIPGGGLDYKEIPVNPRLVLDPWWWRQHWRSEKCDGGTGFSAESVVGRES